MRVTVQLSDDELCAAVRLWLAENHDLHVPEGIPIVFRLTPNKVGPGADPADATITATINMTAEHYGQGPYR